MASGFEHARVLAADDSHVAVRPEHSVEVHFNQLIHAGPVSFWIKRLQIVPGSFVDPHHLDEVGVQGLTGHMHMRFVMINQRAVAGSADLRGQARVQMIRIDDGVLGRPVARVPGGPAQANVFRAPAVACLAGDAKLRRLRIEIGCSAFMDDARSSPGRVATDAAGVPAAGLQRHIVSRRFQKRGTSGDPSLIFHQIDGREQTHRAVPSHRQPIGLHVVGTRGHHHRKASGLAFGTGQQFVIGQKLHPSKGVVLFEMEALYAIGAFETESDVVEAGQD
jgi:hypothetical protein